MKYLSYLLLAVLLLGPLSVSAQAPEPGSIRARYTVQYYPIVRTLTNSNANVGSDTSYLTNVVQTTTVAGLLAQLAQHRLGQYGVVAMINASVAAITASGQTLTGIDGSGTGVAAASLGVINPSYPSKLQVGIRDTTTVGSAVVTCPTVYITGTRANSGAVDTEVLTNLAEATVYTTRYAYLTLQSVRLGSACTNADASDRVVVRQTGEIALLGRLKTVNDILQVCFVGTDATITNGRQHTCRDGRFFTYDAVANTINLLSSQFPNYGRASANRYFPDGHGVAITYLQAK